MALARINARLLSRLTLPPSPHQLLQTLSTASATSTPPTETSSNPIPTPSANSSNETNSTTNDQSAEQQSTAANILRLDVSSLGTSEAVATAISLNNASNMEQHRVKIQEAVNHFQRSEADTGSPEVQIAVMTQRIVYMTKHLQQHRKDQVTKRSLVMLVAQRKRMMRYLLRKDPERYRALAKELGLNPNTPVAKDPKAKGAKTRPNLIF